VILNVKKGYEQMKVSLFQSPIFVFLIMLILLSAIYAPAYTSYYAHHDDYSYFVYDKEEFRVHPFFEWELSNGRYVLAVFDVLAGWSVRSVEDLNRLRFLSVVILAVCGVSCVGLLYKYSQNFFYALLATVCLLTLPPFQVMVMWASSAVKAVALIFSSLAFYWARKALNHSGGMGYSVLAVLSLVAAIMTYPPGAMFYWFLFALLIFAERWTIFTLSDRRILLLSGIGFLAMEVYYVTVKSLQQPLEKATNMLYSPYVLASDYGQKMSWFVREPLSNAMNLWNIFPKLHVTLFVLIIIGSGVLINVFRILRDRKLMDDSRMIWKKSGIPVFIILFLVLLSFSPNLLTTGYAAFYRCSLALTPMIFLIILWATMNIVTLFPKTVKGYAVISIMMWMTVYGVLQARTNMLQYRILPSSKELTFVKDRLRRPDLDRFRRIVFIFPDPRTYQAVRRYDEFGVPATAYPHNIPWILKCALREMGMEPLYRHFYHNIYHSTSDNLPKDAKTLIIDMNGVNIVGVRE